MSNLSFVRHVGDGVETQFALSIMGEDIGYFRTADIHCYVDDVEVPITINPASPHLVILDTAPDVGADILLRREMPTDLPYANFERGNNFGKRQINNSFLQQLYLTQELLDGFTPEGFYWKQSLDFGGYPAKNLGDAVDDSDAMTKGQTDALDNAQTTWQQEQDVRLDFLESGVTSNSRYIKWIYNGGSAIGGELFIDVPYTFNSINAVYINGAYQTFGLAFDYNTTTRQVELAEELEAGDEVVIAIGKEAVELIYALPLNLQSEPKFNTFASMATGIDIYGNLINVEFLYNSGALLETNYHNGTSLAGGAKYKLLTTAEKNASEYSGTEGYACVEIVILGIPSGYWACLEDTAYITLAKLGAISDVSYDISILLNNVLPLLPLVYMTEDYYVNSSPVTLITRSISLIGVGDVKFYINGENNNGIRIAADNVTSTTLNSDVTAGADYISVVDQTGFKVGDVIYISSTEIGDTQWNYAKASTSTLTAAIGNVLYLSDKVDLDFDSSGYTVNIEDKGQVSCTFKDIDFTFINTNGTTCQSLSLFYMSEPKVENVTLKGDENYGITSFGVQFFGCVNQYSQDIKAYNLLYPVLPNTCRGGLHDRQTGYLCRHVIDSAVYTSGTRFTNTTGYKCLSTFAMHPSFDIHIDGVVANNDLEGGGFRTWGGSVSNVTHTFDNSVVAAPLQYWQTLVATNNSVDPYTTHPVTYNNIVSKPNSSGYVMECGSHPNQVAKAEELNISSYMAASMNGSGSVSICNSVLDNVYARGDTLKITNTDFISNKYTDALTTANLGNQNNSVNMIISNTNFSGYTNIIGADSNIYKFALWIGCSFRDITGYFYIPTFVDNTNYRHKIVNSVFDNVANYSTHTTPTQGLEYSQTFATNGSPALP